MECWSNRLKLQHSITPITHPPGGFMRELAMRFLNGELSRRGFLKGLVATGFSLTAAQSVVESVKGYAEAQESPATMIKPFQGEVGELIAECLRAAKVKYMFFCNGSPPGPLLGAVGGKHEIYRLP